jgi:heptosyltransferase-1
VVTDVLRQFPDAQIDWLVEAPFAAIPRLNPGVRRVLPMAWRKWRDELLERATWRAMGALKTDLRRETYDLVLDLQGLVKSALWARQAHAPVAGYDRASLREPLAAWAYQRTAAVAPELHAGLKCAVWFFPCP